MTLSATGPTLAYMSTGVKKKKKKGESKIILKKKNVNYGSNPQIALVFISVSAVGRQPNSLVSHDDSAPRDSSTVRMLSSS